MCDLVSCGSTQDEQGGIPVSDEQRRAFLQGLISLPLAAVLAHPMLAKAAGEKLSEVTVKTASGGAGRGVVAIPAKTPAPTILLIHEWWGLNDQIKAVAAELANEGYVALAVDLYGGKVGTSREEARNLVTSLNREKATEELVAWVEWLRQHKASSGKVGTMGWCFGGGWSLNTSLATPVDATVIYYGNVKKNAEQLRSLESPILGHFGKLDKRINAEMVGGFEKALAAAGKTDVSIHWYDADHAFANPTGSRYDAEDAKQAWSRTLAFFKKHLS